MREAIFWGATGQAKVLRECLKYSDVQLIALFDNNQALKSPFPEVPLYYGREGFESWVSQQSRGVQSLEFLVAIGGDRGRDRIEIQQYLESFGLIPMTVKHPTAFIADSASIGTGSQILANASVCVDVVIGRNCIVNTGASLDHECYLGDGVHICPGAVLAGCVEVGNYCMIGTGAVILPRVKLGQGAIVGAGATVLQDVEPYTVVVGNPAKLLRKVAPNQA